MVITGEIVGQRPMSQKKSDLANIERRSGLGGRLLRPLSAKLLPPTVAEKEGLVDRRKLYGFSGRKRSQLVRLARELGLKEIPQPSTGCALTEVSFSSRVRDLMEHDADASRWDFELLNLGRHIRLNPDTKAVVGRNAAENAALESYFVRGREGSCAYLHPENFLGPDVLVVGPITEEFIGLAVALVLRYSKTYDPTHALVRVTHGGVTRVMLGEPTGEADSLSPL
jgi:hypothetical protein